MKQRISLEDIEALTPSQQENLRSIWKPERYDIAVSQICVNAETDEYRWLEFAIGDIQIGDNGTVFLSDLRLTDGYVKIMEGETEEDEDFLLQEPTTFVKSETIPLLTVGQMITMLHMLDKTRYHFYLLSGNDTYSCEIGDFNSDLKAGILAKSDIKDELVDVLWTTVKMIL
ncbi:MAG: hypothetical protein LBL09_04325 [Oscillospiraceae bacterium]|nr:hypothetical protein [Oscillospiraceae bacterium]